MKFVESVFDKLSIDVDIPIESASFSDIIQELFQKYGGIIIGIIIGLIVIYVFTALFLNKLNKMITGSGTILAWLPGGRTFLCGKLAQSTAWGIFILLFPVLIYNYKVFNIEDRQAAYVALGYAIVYVITVISAIIRFFTCLKDNNNAEYINYKANQIASGNIDPNAFVEANGTMSLTKQYIMQSRQKKGNQVSDYDRNRPVHSSNYKNKNQANNNNNQGGTTNVFMQMVEGEKKQNVASPVENFDDTVNESNLENTIPVIVFKNKNNAPKPGPNMGGGFVQQGPQPFQRPPMNQGMPQFGQQAQGQVIRHNQQMVRPMQPQMGQQQVVQPQNVQQPVAQSQMVQQQMAQRNQYKMNQQQKPNSQPFGQPMQPQMMQPQTLQQQVASPMQQQVVHPQVAPQAMGPAQVQIAPQQGIAQPQTLGQAQPQMVRPQGMPQQVVRPAQPQMVQQQGMQQPQMARPAQSLPVQQGLGQNTGNGLGG